MSTGGGRLGLIHVHTWHSFDSLLPPRLVLAAARRARLDFICVTDHNTLRGAQEIATANADARLEVVIGAEYATDRGDVIGLFLDQEIGDRRFSGVVGAIHEQGGLAVLPHPYRGHRVDDDLFEGIDLVEVFNSQTPDEANQSASRDAARLGLAQIAGADIHTLWELARNDTFVIVSGEGPLRQRLLDGERRFRTRTMSHQLKRYSQVVKRVRARVGLRGAI